MMTFEVVALYLAAWVVCVAMFARYATHETALVLATIRIAVPLGFFMWAFSGEFPLKDGESYYGAGAALYQGSNLWNAWFTEEGRELLADLSKDGPHVFYVWWNALVQGLVSDRREAVVLANVLLSCGTALMVVRMAGHLNMPGDYRSGLLIFQVLNPELVTWSSASNSKDVLVCFLVAAVFGELAAYRSNGRWWHVPVLLVLFLVLLRMRFYLIPLIAVSVLLAVLWQRNAKRVLIVGVVVGAVTAAALATFKTVLFMKHAGAFAPQRIPGGILQVLLTPRPWAISDEYHFLFPAMVWHWAMLPATLAGFVMLWRRYAGLQPFLIFLPLGILLYAGLADFQGPRHRLQFSMVYLWAQYHFLWEALRVQGMSRASAPLHRHSRSAL